MDDAIAAEERAYWEQEARTRARDVEAASLRGDAPHVVAAAKLRLREATDRLAAM